MYIVYNIVHVHTHFVYITTIVQNWIGCYSMQYCNIA